MLHSFKNLGTLLVTLLLVGACSSTPEIQQFSTSTDPSQEINDLESNLNKASQDQVNALSPNNFKKSHKYLREAKEDRSDNKSNSKVLKKVALGNAWLMKANETAKKGANAIPEVVDVRSRALENKANLHAKYAWEKAEDNLFDVGKDFEDDDFSVKNETRQKLLDDYMQAELIAIKHINLSPAEANIKQAEKEGARSVAPQTLALAKKRFLDAHNYIVANRQNTSGIASISEQARADADRLLKITREAKTNKNRTPEQIALATEAESNAKVEIERDLVASQTELGNKEAAMQTMSAETSQLSEQVALDEKYQAARDEFGPNEAEVFKDGDKLVIRLKGLKFPAGQADLAAASYPLMTKLQTVIKSLGDADIDVEGHTDAIGSKELNARLSEARADAVKNYLVENLAVEEASVTAVGYGDEKPISTNKTNDGRAENRRVDIIISPL